MLSRMIFGCGTGRCGTFTLYRLFEAQPGVCATHEGFALPWERDLPQLWWMFINAQARCEKPIWANSSFVWMRYTGAIISHIPDPKFICLKRDRGQVVHSFLHHTPLVNHWTNPDSVHWNPTKDLQVLQSVGWPKYDLPKAEAIGKYWDDYYTAAEYLQERFPDNFKIYDMHYALNSAIGQRDMLSFAGFDPRKQRIFLNRKLNALGKPKGHLNLEDNHVHTGPSVHGGSEEVGSEARLQV